jgi:hypothetical protein
VTREQLEHAIRAACDIADDDEVIIVGSQAILGQYPDAPADLTESDEVDLFPKNQPARLVSRRARPGGEQTRRGPREGSRVRRGATPSWLCEPDRLRALTAALPIQNPEARRLLEARLERLVNQVGVDRKQELSVTKRAPRRRQK